MLMERRLTTGAHAQHLVVLPIGRFQHRLDFVDRLAGARFTIHGDDLVKATKAVLQLGWSGSALRGWAIASKAHRTITEDVQANQKSIRGDRKFDVVVSVRSSR